MKDMIAREGGRLTFEIERADPEAISATYRYGSEEGTHDETVAYDEDGVAYFDFVPELSVGGYDYQVNENFEDGEPSIYPTVTDCIGDCELPQLHICESLPEEGGS